jgi:hypothetical protein
MNRFRIDDSFRIASVGFVFVGELVEGSAKAGMVFEVPEAGHRWHLVVKSVEFVRLKGAMRNSDSLCRMLTTSRGWVLGGPPS